MAKKKKRKAGRQPQASSPFNYEWLFALALLVLVFLTYYPAWNGRLIWDDDAHITKQDLRSTSGLLQIWTTPGATQQYYPLVHSVFWFAYQIWEDQVLPYHLLNILLHAASALLLWRILLRLNVPGAGLAATIFALHPVQVESVAWISELKNTLSGVFFFSASLFYLKFDEKRTRADYIVALLLFILGLLSKSVIATLPPVLLVVFWWNRGRLEWKRDVFPLLPFFVIGIASGLFTTWMERTHIGAQGNQFALSLLERCLIAGRAFWFYLAKLVWPARLTFIYPRWNIDQYAWWQYSFIIAAIALFAVLWFLRRRSRAPLAAFLFFGGVLFPVLGFVNVYPFIYSYVADHFQYLACIGIIVLTSSGLVLWLKKLGPERSPLRYVVPGIIVVVLAVLSWQQTTIYKDAETLYLTTLRQNPDCWLADNNLCSIFMAKGDLDRALEFAKKAVELRPEDMEPHFAVGDALLRKRRISEAIDQYKKAISIRPDYGEGYGHLGAAYLLSNRFAEAKEQYQKALSLTPRSVTARNNLAWLLATCADPSLRDTPRAIQLAEEANQLAEGQSSLVLHTLSTAYGQDGQTVKAIEVANHALQIAQRQGNRGLITTLQKELKAYEAHLSPESAPAPN
jgi:protein O-mannosyl-transferase